jgi:hypothetical protein
MGWIVLTTTQGDNGCDSRRMIAQSKSLHCNESTSHTTHQPHISTSNTTNDATTCPFQVACDQCRRQGEGRDSQCTPGEKKQKQQKQASALVDRHHSSVIIGIISVIIGIIVDHQNSFVMMINIVHPPPWSTSTSP